VKNCKHLNLRGVKKIKLNANFAIFLLFFGAAALVAFQTANWAKAVFWVVIGILFLVADNLKKNDREKKS
jgi:hypothetical protein